MKSKHDDGYRAPETVAAMEAQDPSGFCYLCGRSWDDHEDMDHEIKTQAALRAEYDTALTKRLQEERQAKIRKDGAEARADLRDSVKVLVDAHFRAANQMNAPDIRELAEEEFTLELDDIQMWLETLEETLGA